MKSIRLGDAITYLLLGLIYVVRLGNGSYGIWEDIIYVFMLFVIFSSLIIIVYKTVGELYN